MMSVERNSWLSARAKNESSLEINNHQCTLTKKIGQPQRLQGPEIICKRYTISTASYKPPPIKSRHETCDVYEAIRDRNGRSSCLAECRASARNAGDLIKCKLYWPVRQFCFITKPISRNSVLYRKYTM